MNFAKFAFWIGVALGNLESPITFYPGAETWPFAITSVLLACGFFVRNWRYRIAAVGLTCYFAWLAWNGFHRGIEYKNWLQNRSLVAAETCQIFCEAAQR
jgi:hypothetical protein